MYLKTTNSADSGWQSPGPEVRSPFDSKVLKVAQQLGGLACWDLIA